MTIGHGEVHAKLEFFESDLTPSGIDYRITEYKDPISTAIDGLHAAVAWRIHRDGTRKFLDYSETQAAVEAARVPITGQTDTYLGRMMIRYFRQHGELAEDASQEKWLPRMGLPGSSTQQFIRQRETPVWVSLPQHEDDLLGSAFVEGVEVSLS
jgi:hypothetical protein